MGAGKKGVWRSEGPKREKGGRKKGEANLPPVAGQPLLSKGS